MHSPRACLPERSARSGCSPSPVTIGSSSRSGAGTNTPSRSPSNATAAASLGSAVTCSAQREEAEDAVQHTFAAAFNDLQRGGERQIALKPWLYTIARNRCLSLLRARREQTAELEEIPTDGLHEQVERRAELRELLGDLRELPEEQRAALLLAEAADLSHAEVADVLGCEVGRVKALVFRARSGLIERREARETPCADIREQLANLRGGSLRRSELRHHLRHCPGCSDYREQVRRQRQMLAVALPVDAVDGSEVERALGRWNRWRRRGRRRRGRGRWRRGRRGCRGWRRYGIRRSARIRRPWRRSRLWLRWQEVALWRVRGSSSAPDGPAEPATATPVSGHGSGEREVWDRRQQRQRSRRANAHRAQPRAARDRTEQRARQWPREGGNEADGREEKRARERRAQARPDRAG